MPPEYDRIGHGAEWDGVDVDARVKNEALEQRIAMLEQRLKLVDQYIEFDTETHARELLRAKNCQGIEKAHEQALRENINNGAVSWLCSPGMSAWRTGGARSGSLCSCTPGPAVTSAVSSSRAAPLAWCDFCHKETTFHSENVYKDPWPWNTMWSVNVSDDVRRRALRAAGAVCPH